MLNALDIAVLCDHEWTDGAGDRRTRDRSRRGIHPVLGDGVTPATFPTWDSINGRYTFDGGDYMVLRAADDVDTVLAGMGSAQDESYIFYFDPFIESAGINRHLLFKGALGADWVRIRKTAGNTFQMRVTEAAVGNEVIDTAATVPAAYDGKQVLLSFVRKSGEQEIWTNDFLIASDTDATVDGSSADDCYIGASAVPGEMFPDGTGLRAFLYGQFAATQILLRQLSRYFRGLL